ncbi:vitelline membrane outer layer protein 1-like isoform X1 [Homarus americanus]|uniref:vitelline membrane outer layer protein 1-like isoform X1 n=1 Tax=Homarus americanus TaxID=6706 RepID=UPI001C46F979|nr:vitelline membrane outer layer protein 1-like isoform X1 [Homarus americanus]
MAAFWWSAVCVCLLVAAGVLADERLEVDWAMNWGSWHEKEQCPAGSFVYAFDIKVDSEGVIDETSMNGINLYCSNPSDANYYYGDNLPEADAPDYIISSFVDQWGIWRGKRECYKGFLTGFRMRSESDQGAFGDDTTANDLEMQCNYGNETLIGGGNHRGNWSNYANCPYGMAIYAIQTRVQEFSSTDNTALNNVHMFCRQV